MSIKKRIAFFAVGLLIGIVFVKLIFGKKDVSFDYFPNDRVLKTLRTKSRVFDQKALDFFKSQSIDTSIVGDFLNEGNVNFGESEQRKKPCNFYQIENELPQYKIGLYVKNCDSLVTIQNAFKINAK
jgi:hypothetical protein